MIDVELQISRNFPFRAILHASKFSDSPQLFDIASFYFFLLVTIYMFFLQLLQENIP